MLLFTKTRNGYTPQEKVYFCDDLWRNILSYNTCPICNKYIEKKEVFDIKSKVWNWIQNNFMFTFISNKFLLRYNIISTIRFFRYFLYSTIIIFNTNIH